MLHVTVDFIATVLCHRAVSDDSSSSRGFAGVRGRHDEREHLAVELVVHQRHVPLHALQVLLQGLEAAVVLAEEVCGALQRALVDAGARQRAAAARVLHKGRIRY